MLVAVSLGHLLNDTIQAMLPAIYPILKTSFHLNFGQIGLLTLTFQMTASILQPFIGRLTDRRPMPYSLPIGMVFTLIGLLLLAVAPTFAIAVAGRLFDWHGLGCLPSRVFAGGASCLRRPAGLGTVGLPGWRQHGLGHRTAAGCLYCAAPRAKRGGMVFPGGLAGDRAAARV